MLLFPLMLLLLLLPLLMSLFPGLIWGRSKMSRTEKLEVRGILISRSLKIKGFGF